MVGNGEKVLLEALQSYSYNEKRLAETEERLMGKTYRITPSYGNTGGGSASWSRSKVEDFVLQTERLRRTAAKYRAEIKLADEAMNCPDLTETEREILSWIAAGAQLATYADMNGIYISSVYKMRDRALKKAYDSLKTHFEVILG